MDAIFRNLTRFFALLVFSLLAAILVSLLVASTHSMHKFGLGFLVNENWDPVQEDFGALVPIVGTPRDLRHRARHRHSGELRHRGLLTELSPVWLRRPLGTAIEMLAAIPSIIYGMWGLFIFAPLFQQYAQPFLQKTLGRIPGLGISSPGRRSASACSPRASSSP